MNPSYAFGHNRYANYLMDVGRLEEAIQEAKRAQELDPVSVGALQSLAVAYTCARRYDEAVEQCRKALAMDPNFGLARLALGNAYMLKSMYTEGVAELETAVEHLQRAPVVVAYLGHAYARFGNRVAARKVLERMLAERSRLGYYPASRIALVYSGLGERDSAFEWFGKAVEEHDIGMFLFKTHPVLDPLRSDPRYTDLLRRMNLAP